MAHYFHVYGLPVISTGRTSEVVCFACAARFKQRVLPADIAAKVTAARRGIRTPPSLYSGAFVLLALIGLGIVLSWRGAAVTDDYARSPRAKDIYLIDMAPDGHIGTALFRVVEVDGDSIALEVGNDLYRDELAAHTAIGNGAGDRDEGFGKVVVIARRDLLKLRADRRVQDIIRPGG